MAEAATVPQSGDSRNLQWKQLYWLPAWLVAAVAYAGTLRYELVADARFLIHDNLFLRHWRDLWPNLSHDYFWSSSGNTLPYWRPLTKASWLVEYIAGGGQAWVFHAVQVGWFAALCGGAAVLARRLGASAGWAALGGLAVALHPVAQEPVALVMARSDVVAAAAAVWALALQTGARPEDRGPRWGSLACLALALASKEASVALLPALATLAWLRTPRPVAWTALGRDLAPHTLITALYLVLRYAVLSPTAPAPLAVDPLRWAAGLGRYAQSAVPGLLQSGVTNVPRTYAADWSQWLPGVAAALALTLLLGVGLRRRAPWTVLPVLALASLAPVLLVEQLNVPGVAGKIPLADRWLLPAMLAAQVGAALAASCWNWPRAQRMTMLATAAWLVVRAGLAVAEPAWYRNEVTLLDLEDRNEALIPQEFWTTEDVCRHHMRAVVRAGQSGHPEQVEPAVASMPAECRNHPETQFNLLAAQVTLGRFAAAAATGEHLLIHPPTDRRYAGPLRALYGRALVELGRGREAIEPLQQALALGAGGCDVPMALGRAHVEAGNLQVGGDRLAEAARCLEHHGQPAVALWLFAAQAHAQAGQRELARRELARVEPTTPLPKSLRGVYDHVQRALAAPPDRTEE
ncbi:MAG: hypothetical protein HY902_13405 [Deltaproteobacteria bacterium]|nr:hypothetical protein [Deltaproteobacteria bacterium]